MKPKNVMLLGFVNRAVEYLDKHIDNDADNEKLTELKNIDLQSIKSELSGNLDISLGTMQSTMTTLLHAGNEAFDKFLEKHVDKNDVANEIDRVFDSYYENTKLNSQDELTKLLNFYDLDDDFDIDESIDLPEQPEIREIEDEVEDEYMKQIRENASKAESEIKVEQVNADNEDENLDDILAEILTARKVKEEPEEPVVRKGKSQVIEKTVIKEGPKEEVRQSYVSSLFEDLRKQMLAEDEAKRQKELMNSEAYQKIHDAFPSLSIGFVRSVYDLKDGFASENPSAKSIILLHRCTFKNVEDLRSYVEIVLNHDYNINADEKKLIVDTFKRMANADGKIMTNIFEVANQANVLNGVYEGYRIISEEN